MIREIGDIDKQLTVRLGCATLVMVGVVAILYPVFASPAGPQHSPNCIPNLKQLLTGTQIYAADADDKLPPYYTFDLPAGWEKLTEAEKAKQNPAQKFKDAMIVYMKNEQIFLCSVDELVAAKLDLPSREGSPKVMSYVNRCRFEARSPISRGASGQSISAPTD